MSDPSSSRANEINLGFDDVRRWLMDEAAGPKVQEQFSELSPDLSLEAIRGQFDRIREITRLMESNNGFQVYSYPDLYETLRLLALADSTLYPESLTAIRNILEQTRSLQAIYHKAVPEQGSVWADDIPRIEALASIEQDIKRVIGDDGEVLDSASPALASLRQKLRRSAGTVRSRMNDLVRKYADQGYLNETQAGLRGGRLVLPVISSYKHQVKGVSQPIKVYGLNWQG